MRFNKYDEESRDVLNMTIDEELHKGEKLEKQFGIHPFEYLPIYIVTGVLVITMIGVFLAVPLIIIAEFVRRGHKYYITNKRVIHNFTFLSKKTSSTVFDKIQDIHVTQNMIERIFDIGKVHVNTAGSTHFEIILKGVHNPVHIKQMIEKHIIK